MRRLLPLLLLLASPVLAQNGNIQVLQNSGGFLRTFPVGTTVTFCAKGAPGLPCSPALFTFTPDVNGNVNYTNVTPGDYQITITGLSIASPESWVQSIPFGLGATVTLTGAITIASPGSLTDSGTATFNGTPAINLLATAPDTAAMYGINNANPTFPNTPTNGSTTTTTMFFPFCPPLNNANGNFGCGIFTNRWSNSQDQTNFFFQMPYHPGLVMYNSGLSSAITSISRSSNVVTVNTSTQVSLRPTSGDLNITGVTGCATSPNGHFSGASAPTVVSATQFTFPQTGPNETCNPNTGTASPGGRDSLVFQRNNTSNNVFQAWYLQNGIPGDLTDQIGFIQLPADPTNNAGRFRINMVPTILNTLGVGQGAANDQVLIDGNNRTQGLVTSQAAYNDTTGGAAFSLRNFGASVERFITISNTSDIILTSSRNVTGNGIVRFSLAGDGIVYSSASDGGAIIPMEPFGGMLIPSGKSLAPTAAGAAIIGTAALPIGTVQIGTAATNNFALTPAATAAARTVTMADPLANVSLGFSYNATNPVYQTKRGVAGCTTGASIGGTCATDITVTWGTAFPDTNYSVTCTGSTPTAVPAAPFVVSGTKLAATVHINYFAITAVAASYATIDCIAVHD